MSEQRPKIKTFWLVLNYSCNSNCAGCYAAESGFVNKPMPFNDADLIMRMMKDIGALDCLLIGGEPSIYPRVIDVVEHGTNLGLSMKIVTNGRLLGDRSFMKRLAEAGLKHASVSIEGATAEIHNKVTGAKSFHQVMAAIDNLQELGVSFNTLLTISQRTMDQVVPLAELLHKRGVTNILFNIGLPSGDGDSGSFALEPSHVARIMENAFVTLSEKGIKVKFFATIPLCLIERDLLNRMVTTGYITDGIHCHIYYGSGVAFEPNGDVIPCTHFVNKPLFNIHESGALTPESFNTIWYGDKGIHGSFKEALWQYPHEDCRGCDLWGKCIGGCPFLWTHFDAQRVLTKKGGLSHV